MPTKAQIETITKHYLIAMLWVMPGNDASENPGDGIALQDLPRETIDAARHDVMRFVASCGILFDMAMACYDNGYGQHPDAGSAEAAYGHDFALTRNGHGVGFWDRDSEGLPRVLGEALTRVCKGFPARDLYIGDDGRAYFD